MSEPINSSFTRWYVLAVTAFVVGIATALAGSGYFFVSLTREPKQPFVAPGSFQIAIDEPGEYALDYLFSASFDGRIFSTGEKLPSLMIALTRDSDGTAIPSSSSMWNGSYKIGMTEGTNLMVFNVEKRGDYTLTASGSRASEVLFAFGQSHSMFVPILAMVIGFIVGMGLGFGGLVLLIVTIIRHASAPPLHSSPHA